MANMRQALKTMDSYASGEGYPKEFKLDPKLKRKWVAALTKGGYKQSASVMYDFHSDTYCCLGVLTNEMDAWKEFAGHQGQSPAALDDPDTGDYCAAFAPKASKIPDEVANALAYANDAGITFKQIARWIETRL